jgi:uncharacterized protein (TIGR00290 family)
MGDAVAGARVFCSWSAGKDCALALHEAVGAGARPALLVSMMCEDGQRSRSHGLHRSVLEAQAAAMGLPIRFGAASWAGYEAEFRRVVGEAGVPVGVFGDIDLADHRAWVERVCGEVGVQAVLPLWERPRETVVDDLLAAGFRAVIVAVRDDRLPASLLGRVIDAEVVDELRAAGVDLAGEEGEYHSLVVDGPLFAQPLEVTFGQRVRRDGLWFLDVAVAGGDAGYAEAAAPSLEA